MSSKKIKAYKKGLISEYIAAVYLWFKGYRILKLRYKCAGGEIDIVALKKGTLAMIEVKARSGLETAIEAVSLHNQKRVEQAARRFLSQNPIYINHTVRFDVVALGRRSGLWPVSLRHLDNAWQAKA